MVIAVPARALIPSTAQASGAVGFAVSSKLPESEIASRRAALGAARIADFIQRTADECPPLDPAHVAALHQVLEESHSEVASR